MLSLFDVSSETNKLFSAQAKVLLFKLGLSFFLFGLINNGMSSLHRFLKETDAACSFIRNYPICRIGLGPAVDAEGHNSILQHIPRTHCEGRMAVHLERTDTLCEEVDWMLYNERQWDGGESTFETCRYCCCE